MQYAIEKFYCGKNRQGKIKPPLASEAYEKYCEEEEDELVIKDEKNRLRDSGEESRHERYQRKHLIEAKEIFLTGMRRLDEEQDKEIFLQSVHGSVGRNSYLKVMPTGLS